MSPVSPSYHSGGGLTSVGAQYFSASSNADLSLWSAFTGTSFTFWTTVSLIGMPQARVSLNESHSIFSMWNQGAFNYYMFNIGVTPRGAVVAQMLDWQTLTNFITVQTPNGAVSPASGIFTIVVSVFNSNVGLSIIPGRLPTAFTFGGAALPPSTLHTITLIRRLNTEVGNIRWSIFSSMDGLSRFRGTIFEAGVLSSKHPIAWLFSEGTGTTVKCYEQFNSTWYAMQTEIPAGFISSFTQPTGTLPFNFDLTLQNPINSLVTPWIPSSIGFNNQYTWGQAGTGYTSVTAITPTYNNSTIIDPTYKTT